ncbi:MAG: hypothetical protein JNN08_07625, partial [Bryobacterales bacterium]|nr:hypothetical protein [Bryobacterales bacterium]
MSTSLGLLVCAAALSLGAHAQNHDWPVYLGDKATTHYSTLRQINKENVSRLREVWT